jgi:hypothetical protein
MHLISFSAIKKSTEAVTLAASPTTQLAESRDIIEMAFTEATRLLEFALQKYSAPNGWELNRKMSEACAGDEARLA